MMAALRSLFILYFVPLMSCQENTVLRYNVTEEAESVHFAADVATDSRVLSRVSPEGLSLLEFKITGQSVTPDVFVVNSSTGIVTTIGQLDRDVICPRQSQCIVSVFIWVRSPPEFLEIITVEMNILDINDNEPHFNDELSSIAIPENTAVGSTFAIPRATDRDSPAYGIRGYRLIDKPVELALDFNIDDNSNINPFIKLEKVLDRETHSEFELEIEAFDSPVEALANIATLHLTINVLDTNDNAPYFEQATYTRVLPENYDVSEIVLQVHAVDFDHGDNGFLLYHFDALTLEQYGDLLELDELTGEIRLKKSLDYERETHIELSITATEKNPGNLPATTTVILTIMDVNDNIPQISVEAATGTVGHIAIEENTRPGAFLALINVVDGDSGPSGDVTCDLREEIDAEGTFTLEPFFPQGQYKLTTNHNLDHESRESYAIEIWCRDNGSPALSTTYKTEVRVLDQNDHTPVLQQYEFTVALEENNHIGVELARLNATDPDSGSNSEVIYQIQTGPRNYINVDPYNGSITARMSFDYERVQTLTYHVIAFDQGAPKRTATATVNIDISDQNDEAPKFIFPEYVMSVSENRNLGTEVGQVAATDADSSKYNEYVLEFYPDDVTLFVIEPFSGRILTQAPLDREERSKYAYQVKAFDKKNPLLFSIVNVTINVEDENDHAPVIRYPSTNNKTIELDPDTHKHSVTAIIASDKDVGRNAILTYYITSGDETGAFLLDESSGILYVKDLDKLSQNDKYTLHILVKDNGIDPLTNETVLNIKIVSSTSSLSVNSLILVIVGVVSAVIISVLLIAIILLKRRDCISNKQHKAKKGEAQRPNHHYTLQPNAISLSQESMSELSGCGNKMDTSRDFSADTGSHDLSDLQIRYHANPISGQHTQLTTCSENDKYSDISASDSGMGSHDDHSANNLGNSAATKPIQNMTGNERQLGRNMIIPPDLLQSSHDSLDSYSRPHCARMDSFRTSPTTSHIRTAKIAPRVRSPQLPNLNIDAKKADSTRANYSDAIKCDVYPSSHVTDDFTQAKRQKQTFPRVTFDLSNTRDKMQAGGIKQHTANDFISTEQQTNDSNAKHAKLVTFQPYVHFENAENSFV